MRSLLLVSLAVSVPSQVIAQQKHQSVLRIERAVRHYQSRILSEDELRSFLDETQETTQGLPEGIRKDIAAAIEEARYILPYKHPSVIKVENAAKRFQAKELPEDEFREYLDYSYDITRSVPERNRQDIDEAIWEARALLPPTKEPRGTFAWADSFAPVILIFGLVLALAVSLHRWLLRIRPSS